MSGEVSVGIIRDFFESLQGRGRTVTSTAKSASRARGLLLRGVDLPIDNPMLSVVTSTDSDEHPMKSQPMDIERVNELERMESDPDIPTPERFFAFATVLLTYARLRFSDVQQIRGFGTPFGTLRETIRRRRLLGVRNTHNVENDEDVCPLMAAGMSRGGYFRISGESTAVSNFANAHNKKNDRPPSLLSPKLNRLWDAEACAPASYSETRRELDIACVGVEGSEVVDIRTTHLCTYSPHLPSR